MNTRLSVEQKTTDWRTHVREFGSIVMLSTADYNAPLWTNKQHIASRLATEVPVLYIESLGLRRPRMSYADLRRISRRMASVTTRTRGVRKPGSESQAVSELLEVVSPVVVPIHELSAVRAFNRTLFAHQLGARIAQLPRPRVLWTYTPLAVDIVSLDEFDATLYHCVDDLGSIPGVSAEMIDMLEDRLVPIADVVVTSSRDLHKRLSRLNPDTRYLHNVVDVEHFSQACDPGPIPDDLAAIPEPRAMFVGALSDHKIDWSLLSDVMSSMPDWSFVFIGPLGDEAEQRGVEVTRSSNNAHVLGYRSYDELPGYLRGADLGLIPYRLTKHTASIFPMKVLEYLAAGLPVVSTPLAAFAGNTLPIVTANSSATFREAMNQIDFPTTSLRKPSDYACDHTWSQLLEQLAWLVLVSIEQRS
jgi:glycosyltransferase involved in cell wall biosynthesis